MNALAQEAIRHLVKRLYEADPDQGAADELAPSFARQLVPQGWLETKKPLVANHWTQPLAEVVTEACRQRRVATWHGPDASFTRLSDAF